MLYYAIFCRDYISYTYTIMNDPRFTPTPSNNINSNINNNKLILPKSIKRSLNNQIILSEETYTKALSIIIKRDFFPTLYKQDEISNWINNLNDNVANDDLKYDLSSISLDNFQSKFTSEDNASFINLLEVRNRKNKEKFKWAFDSELLSKQRLLKANENMVNNIKKSLSIENSNNQQLLLPSTTTDISNYAGEGNSKHLVRREKDSMRVLENGTEKPTNALIPTKSIDNRNAGVNGWNFTTMNNLMYFPNVNKPQYINNEDMEYNNRSKRVTKYENTRMDNYLYNNDDLQSTSLASTSYINNAINNTTQSVDNEDDNTPSVRGYKFVKTLPSPNPNKIDSSNLKKLMVGGVISSTPKRLPEEEDDDDSYGSFKIPKMSRRDRLGYQLANKSTRTPSSNSQFSSNNNNRRDLTPAGKALLERTLKNTSSISSTPKRKDVRLSKQWTPTPSNR